MNTKSLRATPTLIGWYLILQNVGILSVVRNKIFIVRDFDPMARITNKTLADLEAEYAKWGEFLNGGVGLLAFSLGISCLGTPRPDISASLSLLFPFIFAIYGQRHVPQKLRALRKTELSGIDEVALLGIEKKYFGFVAIFKNFPVYLIGWCVLGGVWIYGMLKNIGKL